MNLFIRDFSTDVLNIREAQIILDSYESLLAFIIIAFKTNDDNVRNFSKLDDLSLVSSIVQPPCPQSSKQRSNTVITANTSEQLDRKRIT